MTNIIDEAVRYLVYTTEYKPYEIYRTLEIAAKRQEQCRAYMNKRQNKIFTAFLDIFYGE